MIVTFLSPSAPEPVGGVIAMYEFANGLARRGNEVHLVHVPIWGRSIRSVADDLAWFRFDPRVSHHLPGGEHAIPPADVVFGTGAPPGMGLPVLLVQGFDMLHPWLERAAFRTPSLKVCIASWLVDVGERFGVPRDQFVVVHNGIDHDTFKVLDPGGERPFHVALLHHHHQAKAWPVGLDAVSRVRSQVPDLRVAVFGANEPTEPLPPYVTFFHRPDHETLAREVFNRAAVFLQPSDYEGFGLPAVEAMACGCALVSTDNGGSRDYALHDRTALVSAPGDAGALARHVVELLSDRRRREALAEAGTAHVARFHWDRAAEQLETHLARYVRDPAAFQEPPGPELDLELPEGDWGRWALGTADR